MKGITNQAQTIPPPSENVRVKNPLEDERRRTEEKMDERRRGERVRGEERSDTRAPREWDRDKVS